MPTPVRELILEISDAHAGERIDRVLVEMAISLPLDDGDVSPLEGVSRSRLQKLIADGHVLCDGKPIRASHRLTGGERVQLTIPEPTQLQVEPQVMALDVLYEDSDCIAINKPAGLVVHPAAGHPDGTLVNGLLAHCDDLSGIGGVLRPGIVHRLDRYTSGVMVVAKNDKAHEHLARQFSERRVDKQYTAFVFGIPSPAEYTIETFYGRHPRDRKRFSSRVAAGKSAVTTYKIVTHRQNVSQLVITLHTGRTHQIRVHLADRGHPVVGDSVYGGTRVTRAQGVAMREIVGRLDRQALHASVLSLTHPESGKEMILEAPLPPELVELERLVHG